ncbi:MAG: DUF3365 domain-containing protein [Ignavibacteriales bacterium]|nr:DUF3365 domain-containing protein [Ignavibacteriales bacterium]MCF8315364.1 DUF3365 domain-containing protein [Ignavibacteriales bacterium]MCF8436744.1 DUF3365 domain-containing protein [Ignavibacteriales bacterium]
MKKILLINLLISTIIFISCNGKDEEQSVFLQENRFEKVYARMGDSVSTKVHEELLRHLSNAIAEGGTAHAVNFCSLNALNIMDSLSKVYNCDIRRISQKYRNLKDKPVTKLELDKLKEFEKRAATGDKLKPVTVQDNNKIYYFKPIFTGMPLCLNCHGVENTDIQPDVLAKIKELYPGDKAREYALGDFRGAWFITFLRN